MFALYQNFDEQLAKHEFIGGDSYSIADIAVFPALKADDEAFFEQYSNIQRWYAQVYQRSAVQRGMAYSSLK